MKRRGGRKTPARQAGAESLPPELSALIKIDAAAGRGDGAPIVRITPAAKARESRVQASATGADIECVRQGDRGAPLARLADRLAHGWVEAAWGGDPEKLPPWSVLTPQRWALTEERTFILRQLALRAKTPVEVVKRQVLKSAVIAAIHDDQRPVWRRLEWPIFGDDVPAGADQVIGRLKPGEIDEWDVYVEWFRGRVVAIADQFVDEERETRLTERPMDDLRAAMRLKELRLPDPVPSGEQRTVADPSSRSTNPLGVMKSLVAVLVGEGPDSMKPVLTSEAPRVVDVVRDAINAEIRGMAPEVRPATEQWAGRLWTCPPETRLGVRELAEAVGRPRSWVYRHTSPAGDLAPIPHRRLDGLLVFTAAEVRDWLRANEEAH